MSISQVPRRRMRVFSLDELMEFCKGLTGNRKHDHEIGVNAGISKHHVDLLRELLGKVEYSATRIKDNIREAVLQDYKNGVPVHDIAIKYSLPWESYVYNIVKQCGVETLRKDKWSFLKFQGLINLKEVKKYKWSDIAKSLGKTRQGCICKYKAMTTDKWSPEKLDMLKSLRDTQTMSWDKIGYALFKHPKLCQSKYESLQG